MGRLKLDWLGEDQRLFLERGYLKPGVTPEERYEKICNTIENICLQGSTTLEAIEYTKNIGDRFRRYITNNWVSFASPILSNFGEEDGLPISCNHARIDDTLDSIYKGVHETGMLAKHGAGTAMNFSNIRPLGSSISTGGKSESVLEWIELYAHMMSKTTQGSVRRGFLTAYLSAGHSEILEFLDIGTKKFTGAKATHFQTITTAVTIPKGWMEDLIAGDKDKRKVWAKIHKTRNEIGYPYILFEENCNKNCPQVYIDKGMWIDSANICIEAIEYSDAEKTFACCLSSVNLMHYDDWKDDPNFIFDMNLMLDCVLTEYIRKGKELSGLGRAVKFAEEHRAIGLGTMGFIGLLQKKSIAVGDFASFALNKQIFSGMREECDRASRWMGEHWGEPKMMEGYGLRNSSRMAQAPTKSTAFIMQCPTENTEVPKSNYHEKDLSKIQVEYKNPMLVDLLNQKGQDTPEVWKSILKKNGSVQHLDFLSEDEKKVFRTFSEVSQVDLIKLAAQRQPYIDMGQSLNLMIHPDTPPREINKLYLLAYDEGIKSLYYQYSINAAQQFNQNLLECSSCEG